MRMTNTSHNRTAIKSTYLLFIKKNFGKFEIRNPKSETNSKFKCSNVQNNSRRLHYHRHNPVWIIRIFAIRICFEFCYSNFGFFNCQPVRPSFQDLIFLLHATSRG